METRIAIAEANASHTASFAVTEFPTNPPVSQLRYNSEMLHALLAFFMAASLNLHDLSGSKVQLRDYRGKSVVLNFWATWCVPCRAEIPALVELQAKYARQGLQIVGISIDDTVEKMQPFVTKYKINYPALTAVNNEAVLDAYGPMVVVPWTVMVKRDGTACSKHIGPINKEAFDREIKALL
jgi:thiol-disulfide isomerase/thioredoxin